MTRSRGRFSATVVRHPTGGNFRVNCFFRFNPILATVSRCRQGRPGPGPARPTSKFTCALTRPTDLPRSFRAGRQHLPDDPVASVAIFELEARWHEIARALGQTLGRQVAAPGVAEQRDAAAPGEDTQPARAPAGPLPPIAHTAAATDLPHRHR